MRREVKASIVLYPINPETHERMEGIPVCVCTGGVVFKVSPAPSHVRADLSYKLCKRVMQTCKWFQQLRGWVEFEADGAVYPSDQEIRMAVNGAQ